MPSRIIREDILTSSRIDELDPPTEVFYRRLLSKCDDHGLYDARPAILRASLYPLRIDRVREADCSRWMAACQKAGLLVLYAHDGRPYLQVLNTRWIKRSDPKYPLPTDVNNCAQLKTVAPVVVDVVVCEDVVVATPGKRAKSPRKCSMPEGFAVSERVKEWASGRGIGRLDEHLDAFRRKATAKGYQYVDWDSAFMEAIREDWAKLGTTPPSAQVGPSKVTGAAAAFVASESKLERENAYLRAQHSRGQITDEDLAAGLAEARNKYGNGHSATR